MACHFLGQIPAWGLMDTMVEEGASVKRINFLRLLDTGSLDRHPSKPCRIVNTWHIDDGELFQVESLHCDPFVLGPALAIDSCPSNWWRTADRWILSTSDMSGLHIKFVLALLAVWKLLQYIIAMRERMLYSLRGLQSKFSSGKVLP